MNAAFCVFSMYILSEATVLRSQRLCKKKRQKKINKKGQGRPENRKATCIKNVILVQQSDLAASLYFLFHLIFFNNGDRLSVKLKEKGAKLYSEWFICTLGGLTLCPIVNGDRKGFLFMFSFNN